MCFINEEAGCPTQCGIIPSKAIKSACTGIDINFVVSSDIRNVVGSECACANGWWGSACDNPCPGMDASTGEGTPCNGNGICDVETGECTCDACHVLDKEGNCVPNEPLPCINGGRSECDKELGTHVCRCPGQRSGPICELCECQVRFNCSLFINYYHCSTLLIVLSVGIFVIEWCL